MHCLDSIFLRLFAQFYLGLINFCRLDKPFFNVVFVKIKILESLRYYTILGFEYTFDIINHLILIKFGL